MNLPNVFIHNNNTVSAPLCKLGENYIRAWYFGNAVIINDEFKGCNNPQCSCNNDTPVRRKGTSEEKQMFYSGVNDLLPHNFDI